VAGVAAGVHSLVARARDYAGTEPASPAVQVRVLPQEAIAVWDLAFKAPRCATVGAGCASGTLLNGRGTVGPEPNAPNTIGGSCPDDSTGVYHRDESNDWIRVRTVDGSPLSAGKVVRVEAMVWAYAAFASDKLDLYYAADAGAPAWTYLTTLTPPAAGQQTLSATYTLPTGALQAVRARFRYGGSAAPCGTGAYGDHDDLVFAVN
jgi:leucyl aminopeptidase